MADLRMLFETPRLTGSSITVTLACNVPEACAHADERAPEAARAMTTATGTAYLMMLDIG
ncbi:MAG TPA: hypothetical protein VK012_00535 [Gemmatimonadales bacterium]|nr:hypothetical protein [Gemmatimonadales bacterium]